MHAPDTLRQLARRLVSTADRVTSLTAQRARAVADAGWECPRGRRAGRRAGELSASARARSDHLRAAAHELGRAAHELDHGP
jgi:hypothetical protein